MLAVVGPVTSAALSGLLVLAVSAHTPARAEARCSDCLRAGAATVPLEPPPGTPLAGYGGGGRRLLFPDLFGRYPHAFWLKPSQGELDPVRARALVVEHAGVRLVWIAVDLIAVERSFTDDVRRALGEVRAGPGTVLISASHTHSGPGAFGTSGLWGLVALDRLSSTVRSTLIERIVAAVRRADAAKVAARLGGFSVTAPPVTIGRLGHAVDPEIGGIKVVTTAGAPVAVVWNYAIHGTMLSGRNLKFSGDVMGLASAALERDVRVPVLFVNGAVADVSPSSRGPDAAQAVAEQLAAVVRGGWTRADASSSARLGTRIIRVGLPRPSLSLRNCLGRWVPRIALPLTGMLPTDAELAGVAVGDTAVVTIPGELQTGLGQVVKRAASPHFAHALVAGVSNDYLGYFVSAADYDRTTYVSCASLYGPDAGEGLADAAARLLRDLGEDRRRGAYRSAPSGKTAGESRLLAGSSVPVDHALADRPIERANRIVHGTLIGPFLGDRGARRFDRRPQRRAQSSVAQSPSLVLAYSFESRLRVRHVTILPLDDGVGRSALIATRAIDAQSSRVGDGIAR